MGRGRLNEIGKRNGRGHFLRFTVPSVPWFSFSIFLEDCTLLCPAIVGPGGCRGISGDVAGDLHYRYRWKKRRVNPWGEMAAAGGGRRRGSWQVRKFSNTAGEKLRTRVLHQAVIKAMSVLSSGKKVLSRFAAGTSAAPRKSRSVPG